MRSILNKFEILVYKLLKEDGKQSKLNDIVEYFIMVVICLNVLLIVLESIGGTGKWSSLLSILRASFFIFFLTEYLLRLLIADIVMKDRKHPFKSRVKYMLSFRGIVDLLALMPVILENTIIDFRIFRVLRLLRITQLKSLKAYTDILVKVLKLKGSQFILTVLFNLFLITMSEHIVLCGTDCCPMATGYFSIA